VVFTRLHVVECTGLHGAYEHVLMSVAYVTPHSRAGRKCVGGHTCEQKVCGRTHRASRKWVDTHASRKCVGAHPHVRVCVSVCVPPPAPCAGTPAGSGCAPSPGPWRSPPAARMQAVGCLQVVGACSVMAWRACMLYACKSMQHVCRPWPAAGGGSAMMAVITRACRQTRACYVQAVHRNGAHCVHAQACPRMRCISRWSMEHKPARHAPPCTPSWPCHAPQRPAPPSRH
jgi:hypothetical protein